MTPPTTSHDHAGFEIPDTFADPLGRPVDHDLLGRFVGAGYDGCPTCQDPLLTRIVEDATTTARLVELACVAAQGMFGGLPSDMIDSGASGLSSPEFRRLARTGLDGTNQAMFALSEQMSTDERRAAANTAADILIGYLATCD